jgi:hypothetical protein
MRATRCTIVSVCGSLCDFCVWLLLKLLQLLMVPWWLYDGSGAAGRTGTRAAALVLVHLAARVHFRGE